MTEKYTAYLSMLAVRDQALCSLAALAIGVALAWELIKLWPEPWTDAVRRLYLIGGMVLYVITLIVVALMGDGPNV